MTAENTLQRDDIVGKRVKCIYQSAWDVDPDGYGACSTFIELEDGIAFELQSQNFGIHPILTINLGAANCSPSTESYLSLCAGKTILEVLVSQYWPGIGLLLSDYYFVYMRDFPNSNRSGALLIGAYSDRIGDTYELSDVVPYWQQKE